MINNIIPKKFPAIWMKKVHPKISEEERIENVRKEYAEIICDLFPKKINHQEIMDEINDNMQYISEYIEYDNLRLRDEYLNNEIIRTQKYLDSIIDYQEKIKQNINKFDNNKEKITNIMNDIDNLTAKMEEVKKNRPYSLRKHSNILSKEEVDINNLMSECIKEKNSLEEENKKIEYNNTLYESLDIEQYNLVLESKKYIEYIESNWENYYHNGFSIVLPLNTCVDECI